MLVITGLTVGITNAYLSSAEARRSLVLHDVADDGTIVRSNRFELVFTSSTRRLITEVQAVLFSPLLTGGQSDPRNYQRGVNQQVVYVTGPNDALIPTLQNVMGGDITYSDPVSVQGRIPTRYQVYQGVRQWTPQLNRHFSIGQPADALAVDWSGLSIPNVAQESSLSGANWQMLLFQIRSQLGPQANLAVCTTTSQIMNTDPAHNARPGSMAVDAYQRQFQGLGYLQNPGVTSPYDSSSPLMNALLRLTSSPSQGLASLTSQTSPHGGRSLDDLPLSIAGTTDRWWLLVIVPQGDNIVVIRKSFRYAENSLQPMLAPAQLSPGS